MQSRSFWPVIITNQTADMGGPHSRGISGSILRVLTFYIVGISCVVSGFTSTATLHLGPRRHTASNSHELQPQTALHLARGTTDLLTKRWFFPTSFSRNDGSTRSNDEDEDELTDLERRCLRYAGDLIRTRMGWANETDENDENQSSDEEAEQSLAPEPATKKNERAMQLASGRFLDLTCTIEGERAAESLFEHAPPEEDDDVIRGAVIAVQSLLIMGSQVGVKGSPHQIKKSVSHLREDIEESSHNEHWDRAHARKLKHDMDITAGTQLLAEVKKKRTAQGAFDLLVGLGIFEPHEELSLLRSGFPTRFTDEEESAAFEAEKSIRDPDEILGLRQDFRHFKTYTIDGEGTQDIDDGLSVEKLTDTNDATERLRYWIHIADADRWAPRDSNLFDVAKTRATSVYLPTGSVPMFPESVGNGIMSLRQGHDCCALSLGVELNEDGSIDTDSIIVIPSMVQVKYRLTYNQVDEMMDAGVGYFEEWELGAMLTAATKRRALRAKNGSSEGRVTTPIPQAELKVVKDDDAEDNTSIKLDIEVTHNAGSNQTSIAEVSTAENEHAAPASQAFLLVTEMMIMAGEAIGKWRTKMLLVGTNGERDKDALTPQLKNDLDLPFRSQVEPDFRARASEVRTLQNLKETNNGYPHAWYFRRFFKPVKVTKDHKPHFGLGLSCYVQWSSPIRRFGDLQAHTAIKRYLRRKRVNKLLRDGSNIPSEITAMDLGCELPSPDGNKSKTVDPIDYKVGQALGGAARFVQRNSQQYWMFEYIRRMVSESADEVSFECVVLGCVDPERLQYAVYAKELGLEHRYLSEMGSLKVGQSIWLKVANVNPRMGLLTLSLASRASGMASRVATPPASAA